MIELLSESLEGLSAAMIAELGRYRHQVFIEKLGWDVVSTSRVRDQEFDQFDHPQTRYIVAMGRQGICGCARLLPTTDAYLLKEVFAYLCSETPPSDPSVWELSRYAASAADDPQLAMKIFWSSLQCAWYLGASSVVAVTTTAMERYFVRNGVILQRLGPPQKVKARRWSRSASRPTRSAAWRCCCATTRNGCRAYRCRWRCEVVSRFAHFFRFSCRMLGPRPGVIGRSCIPGFGRGCGLA